MRLYYIWDAYCGWCYGFDKHLTVFMENHPELDLDMLSGGLFAKGNEKTTKELAAYQSMNHEIANRYGVVFGEEFEKNFQQDLEVNSLHIAKAFSVIRKYLPSQQHVSLGYRLQQAFYIEGQILSELETYQKVLDELSLNSSQILKEIEQAWSSDEEPDDFHKVSQLGVPTYPTLILEKDGKYYDLRGQATSAQELEKNYQQILSAR